MMDDAEVRILVSGMVQGVGFRYYTYRKAEKLGLKGFVRNLEDGRVEILASGPRGMLEELITSVKVGPRGADVRQVVADWVRPDESYRSFEIR